MTKPMIIGGLMGVMMLWMLHRAITGGGVTGWALIAFIGAHVALALVAVTATVFAARLSPRARNAIARLHRPSLRHVGTMMASATVIMAAVHLGAHGFGGI